MPFQLHKLLQVKKSWKGGHCVEDCLNVLAINAFCSHFARIGSKAIKKVQKGLTMQLLVFAAQIFRVKIYN